MNSSLAFDVCETVHENLSQLQAILTLKDCGKRSSLYKGLSL